MLDLTSGEPEHLERAIYRTRNILDGTYKDRDVVIGRLSYLEGLRLGGTANTNGAPSILSEYPEPPSFRDIIASLPETMVRKPTSMKILEKHLHPLRASYIEQLTNLANIEDDINYCRHLLVYYPVVNLLPPPRQP